MKCFANLAPCARNPFAEPPPLAVVMSSSGRWRLPLPPAWGLPGWIGATRVGGPRRLPSVRATKVRAGRGLVRAELSEEVADVELDGVRGQVEIAGDLLHGEVGGQVAQDARLALC